MQSCEIESENRPALTPSPLIEKAELKMPVENYTFLPVQLKCLGKEHKQNFDFQVSWKTSDRKTEKMMEGQY